MDRPVVLYLETGKDLPMMRLLCCGPSYSRGLCETYTTTLGKARDDEDGVAS